MVSVNPGEVALSEFAAYTISFLVELSGIGISIDTNNEMNSQLENGSSGFSPETANHACYVK